MEKTYLSEAFKALSILDEDVFDATVDGIEDLKDFKDDDIDIATFDVIDPEAETEEELEDSYIGKVILDCCTCRSKLFENKDAIVFSETGEVVNEEKECPYCHSIGGYKIIGEVAPYTKEKVDTEEDSEVEVKVDDDVVKTESLKRRHNIRKLTTESFKKRQKKLKESYVIDTWGQVDEDPREFADRYNLKCEIIDRKNDETTFKFSGAKEDLEKAKRDGYFYCDDCKIEEGSLVGDVSISANVPVSGNSVGFLGGTSGEVSNASAKTESFDKVEIETDKEKIKIESEPKDGEETIVPVSPETKDEIESEQEIEIDDFSEEDFDDLGESFLKKTYSNVTGYKTTSAKQIGNTLKLEGVISFNSGKQKKTQFVFEAKDTNGSKKVRFVGENAQISRGKKAFTLNGRVAGKKFLSESLNYNYRVKDAEGKSKQVYGTVKRRK